MGARVTGCTYNGARWRRRQRVACARLRGLGDGEGNPTCFHAKHTWLLRPVTPAAFAKEVPKKVSEVFETSMRHLTLPCTYATFYKLSI